VRKSFRFPFSFFHHTTECRLDNIGGTVATILEQVPVNAERDRHRGMAETAADRYRVHARRDDLAGMSMAQRMQRDLGELELGQGACPLVCDGARSAD
jgi:hypothetical protein